MHSTILQKLNEVEEKYDVKILYACETGSRAWGFPSPDSDYDVRFVFAFKDYMTIDEPRDVIEFQVDETWDITGWDLRKSLRLFRSTNSAMIERLNSPIIYKETGSFREQLKALMPQYYAPKAGIVRVRRPERDLLLKIRNGDFEYDYLLKLAEDKLSHVNSLFEKSTLPEKPDFETSNGLLIQLRDAFYQL